MENNEEKELEKESLEEDLKEKEIEDKPSVSAKKKEKTKLSKKQKIQIIISAILLILVLIGIILFLLLRKPKEDTPSTNTNTNTNSNSTVTNQEIVNQYGERLEELIVNYSKQNGKVPEIDSLSEYVKVGDYKISCKEKRISANQKIYLGECHVNDSEETYSYGVKEEQNPVAETLTVYKGRPPYYNRDIYQFSFADDEKSYFKEVATVPCKNDKCQGWVAFDQYAVVDENDNLYVYDYVNKKYLDIELLTSLDLEFLSSDEKLYGIYYEKNNKKYLYNVSSNKTMVVDGTYYETMGWEPSLMLSSGYAPLAQENKRVQFVNLTTDKIDFSLDNVASFEVDPKTNKVYILQSNEPIVADEEKNYKFRVYDSKGSILFGGQELGSFYVVNGTFIINENGTYELYNSKYQKIYTSKKYTDIVDMWENYILVLDGTNLNLIDYNENILTTFITDWSNKKYYYHSMLSGWYTENGKNGIYLVIEGDNVPISEILKQHSEMTIEELENYDFGYEYYYIPTTKESGKIATYIGGYAKPVLYLYPLMPMWINVTFKYPESLTTTYPKYQNNWSVLANPNGDLRDKENKYYYGLYWEEKGNHRVDFQEGFYVTKENAIEFLEEKLSIIGLNDRERNEFIMYWLPILEKNEKNLVYFELTEERNAYSPITINPRPNSMLRMAIHVKKVNQEVKIKEQKLSTFKRDGFTVVEWGGVSY